MTTPSPQAIAGALGGRSRSAAKLASLARLHASRRGRPVHPPAPPALADLRRLHLRGVRVHGVVRNPVSISAIAREVGVDQRTLRRWFAGIDRPAVEHHDGIDRAWAVLREIV